MKQYLVVLILPMFVSLLKSLYKNNKNKKKVGELLYEYRLVANLNLVNVFLIALLWSLVFKEYLNGSGISQVMFVVISVEYLLLIIATFTVSFKRPSFYEHGILHYKHHVKWDYIRGYEFRDSRWSHKKLLTLRIIAQTDDGNMDFDMDYSLDKDTFEDILSLLISKGVGPLDKERLII